MYIAVSFRDMRLSVVTLIRTLRDSRNIKVTTDNPMESW